MNAISEKSAYATRMDERADRDLATMQRHVPNRNVAESQGSQESQTQCAPEPLRRLPPPPEPYPAAQLGPILGPACKCLLRVVQAPAAICGAALLAASSLSTQALADVHIDGRVIPLSLWLLTVADSGERKSAVDGEAMRGVRDLEHERSLAFRDACAQRERDLEEWNLRRDIAKSLARKTKGQGLASALDALGPMPQPPLNPSLIASDFTAEGLAKLLLDGHPSIGAFTDEGGLVFGGHGMTKETVTRTAATLSKLWDRGELDRVRSLDGAVKMFGKRLALHLLVQPVVAERALANEVLIGQGFLARCLLAWPEGAAGTRLYVPESVRDNDALVQFTSRIRDLLRRDLPLVAGSRSELAPNSLYLTADAKEAWVHLHNTIEADERPDGRFAKCKPWASKAAEQCLRVAGVLTMIEQENAHHIDRSTIERAAELVLWHLGEAARLAGTAELSPETRDAEALLEWCHQTGRQLLHSRDALQNGPSRIRERRKLMQAASELVRSFWAHPIEGGAEIDGAHRRHVWRIVPAKEGR